MNNQSPPQKFITVTIKDEKERECVVVSAQEYPFMNCQPIPTTRENRQKVIEKLKERGWVAEVPGRSDFVMIHIGGGKPLPITQENAERIAKDMQQCLMDAARYWATFH